VQETQAVVFAGALQAAHGQHAAAASVVARV
jgi:hypothetical protein